MNENQGKWQVKYKEDGTFWYAQPHEMMMSYRFISKVCDERAFYYMVFGQEPNKEQMWRMAQKIYNDKFCEEVPASYLEHYLP